MNTLLQMEDGLSGPPPPQPFEIVLARKISSKGGHLLRTFTSLDEDKDGILNKTDLKIGLQNLFNIDLRDDQINTIFLRFALINNLTEKGSSDEELNGMRFQAFVKYIEDTADSNAVSTDNLHGAAGFAAGKNLTITTPQSLVAKRKELRKIVYNVIQQNARSAGDGGMAATYIFLGMDSLRNNRISKCEFVQWLRTKMGLNLSDDEFKLVIGNFWKEEATGGNGLTFQECVSFVECLELESEGRDENFNPTQEPFCKELIESTKRQGHGDFQEEVSMPEILLESHSSLVESDIEVITQFRATLHSEEKPMKDLFTELTKSQSHYFTEAELKVGMNRHGIKVSDDQLDHVTKYFGNDDGQFEFFHFVKLFMEKI